MTGAQRTAERYVLATGDEGEDRLELVEAVHGADTDRLLERARVGAGMRVVDVGCGIGAVSCRIGRRVGRQGEVVGVDISPEQVALAARRASQRPGNEHVRFVEGSAYDTGLGRGAFDAVFARFVLMHLARPMDALIEMGALLKPGGMLIVEDGDFSAPYCVPGSTAFDRCFELYREAVTRQGADPLIGPSLPVMAMDAGFPECNVAIVQPVLREGEAKRLPEWTLLEAGPALVEAGLTNDTEITAIAEEMRRLAMDPSTRFGMAQMTQVWAAKP